MRALVTGSNGFIGSTLVEYLLSKGSEVLCLVRKTSDLRWLQPLAVKTIYGDLRSPESLAQVLKKTDLVFHLAGVTKARDAQAYFAGNVQTTKNLLDACEKFSPAEQKFVFVSSQAAGGPSPDDRPITEADPANPISLYGRSKLKAEDLVLKYSQHRHAAIIRPPSVYGPRDRDILTYLASANRGILPLLGDGRQKISMIHVEDLVRGIFLASQVKEANGRVYYLSGDEEWNWHAIGDLVARTLNKKPIRLFIPFWLLDAVSAVNRLAAAIKKRPALLNSDKVREMKQPNWLCSNARAKAELTFRPQIELESGFRQTVDWYRRTGWL